MIERIKTIVVTTTGRKEGYDLRSAYQVAKASDGIVYYRHADTNFELKIEFANNSISEFRVKYHRKVVSDLENAPLELEGMLCQIQKAIFMW